MNIEFLKTRLLYLMLVVASSLSSQVTIGTSEPPSKGALLQLKDKSGVTGGSENARRGLGSPRVSLTNLTPTTTPFELSKSIGNTGDWDKDGHVGLLVYNASNREIDDVETCPGLHMWDGEVWQSLISYPAIETRKVLVGMPVKGNITLLGSMVQAINPNNPKWKELGENPTDYVIGAAGPTMTDADNNTYDRSVFMWVM